MSDLEDLKSKNKGNIELIPSLLFTHNNWEVVENYIKDKLLCNIDIKFISFLDICAWRKEPKIDGDWVGIIHEPPNTPKFHDKGTIKDSEYVMDMIDRCRGLFCTSESQRQWVIDNFKPKFFVRVIHHPLSSKDLPEWNYEKFLQERRLYQIGAWLRVPYFIYKIDAPKYKKYLTPWRITLKNAMGHFLKRDGVRIKDDETASVEHVTFLTDEEYNDIHEHCLVILNLYASTCNNVIMESITNGTPILINRLPEVEAYLGEDYPLFYDTKEDAERLLNDDEAILKAHKYLKALDKSRFTLDYLVDSINEELKKLE